MAKTFFLMGVSGSGKTTVLQQSGILERDDMHYVQSYTTRPLRDGEKNGEKYHHITREAFQSSIDAGAFLEWATVHKDYLYGTKIADVLSFLDEDISVIKELEIYGLEKIMQDHPTFPLVSIFLDIDDVCMEKRINGRGVMTPEVLAKRITSASYEREQAGAYCDYIIDASQPLANVVEAFMDILRRELGEVTSE